MRQSLILVFLLALICLPRLAYGFQALARGERLIQQGDLLQAATAFASAARRIPGSDDLWGAAGQAAWKAGDPSQARTFFEEGLGKGALSGSDWLAYGDVLQSLGEEKRATTAWTESLELEPSAGANMRLGEAALKAGVIPQAEEYLMQAATLAPEDPKAAYKLGLVLVATSPADAVPWLMKSASLDPRLEPTVGILRTVINQAMLVDNPAYQLAMAGRALASMGEWGLAREAFDRATQSDPGYGEAWAWLGEARQQTGDDGREQLEKAIALSPQSASVHALDGLYWLRQGKPGLARAAYLRAASLEPENAFWQIALGDTAAAGNELMDALAYYQRATQLAPTEAATWRALALFCLDHETDIQNTGVQAARQLLRLAPEHWLSHDIAGRLATMLGEELEAEMHLLKAIELDPQQAAATLHLGLAYLESGQADKAYDKLMDTVNLDPDGSYGWQASRLLERYFP